MRGRSALQVAIVLAVVGIATAAVGGERFIPVVAQVQGAEGAYWNTELWVSNVSDAVGTYVLTFLPSGSDNSRLLAEEVSPISIGPGETVHLRDVVPPGSTGALRFAGSEGVVVRCRVYNARGQSSVGQMVPALTREEMVRAGGEGVLVPLVRSSSFRTNVGFFNPGENAIRVHAVLVDAHGQRVGAASYGVEPGSQVQINDFLLSYRVSKADGYQVVLTANDTFAAYATIVDSRSGAAVFVLPVVR
ncbi:MAG: hypothetical protein LJE95_01730 [Acidobacteria bacterium]|jgi:hypothetical protein|nr:hypothetical protein [Acidobacteriota bacterium]